MRKNRNEIKVENMDDLAIFSDEDLSVRETELNIQLEKLTKKGFDTKNVEIELAYIQREWQIRNIRSKCHEVWLEKIKKEIAEEEKNLPVFANSESDFNNRSTMNVN